MACLIGQNILTNYFHVKYHSTSIRQVEAGLRATLIKKIQELSIPYQRIAIWTNPVKDHP